MYIMALKSGTIFSTSRYHLGDRMHLTFTVSKDGLFVLAYLSFSFFRFAPHLRE